MPFLNPFMVQGYGTMQRKSGGAVGFEPKFSFYSCHLVGGKKISKRELLS
jgi:hypothetical protein